MSLRTIAAIRTLAEERAREVHDAAVRAIKARHLGSYAQSLIDALPPMWVDVDAHLALLCDLTRPDSRDAVARLVERFGDASDADKARHCRDNPDELEALALAVLA